MKQEKNLEVTLRGCAAMLVIEPSMVYEVADLIMRFKAENQNEPQSLVFYAQKVACLTYPDEVSLSVNLALDLFKELIRLS